jgi:hypothetical protein
MPVASTEELMLVPLEPFDREPAARQTLMRLSDARAVFGAASRLARHAPPQPAGHRGPSWFDSSWELRSGCEVREGWPADATLREWIEGWLYPARGASFSAT